MLRLTAFRQQILAFILTSDARDGHAPGVRPLARHFRKSPSTMHFHLRQLEALKIIEMPPYRPLQITEKGHRYADRIP